jgi:hypothetical protein
MIIRGYFLKILARPILFPILVVTSGFWYGSYKVNNKIASALLSIDTAQLKPSTKYASFFASGFTGGLVIYLGRSSLSNVVDIGLVTSDVKSSTSAGKRFAKVASVVKSVFPGKRGVMTVFMSSLLSAWAKAIVEKL